ncbi:MAG: GLUG motif-containing protein [Deferribacterales bacterium]
MTFLISASFLLSVAIADAGPSGGVVSAGSAAITQTTGTTTINQSSQNAAINWQSFSIDRGETVNFRQPNKDSITLNRIVGSESSVINGALNANGQVFILNSNGVLFGKNASVNTAGLVATTMSLSDKDFMDGNYSFKDASDASVINMGSITISDAGYAALLGADVGNSGSINVVRGKIYMSGADSATINLNGNSLVELTVDKSVVDALVENSGAVIADGGDIFLTTSSAEELISGVVNNTGLVQASTMDDFSGDVIIFAHGGTANVGGTITTGKGEGFIETSGAELNIEEGTNITTGHWLIDPTDVTIDSAMAATLEGQLASGNADVTTSDGSITVDADITINANTLTLDAAEDITVNSTINVNNTGGIDFEYGGDMKVTLGEGVVNLSDTSSLTMNGVSYTIINDYAEWAAMSGALSGSYALGADLDLTGVNYSYIGSNGSPFTGKMNGLGHSVSNLTIDAVNSNYVGLFGVTNGAVLSNIFVDNAHVHSTGGWYVGALAGSVTNTYIYNTGVDVDVYGASSIGGLVGELNEGTNIASSFSEGKVENSSLSGINPVGGLVGSVFGFVDNMSIKDSYSTADVTSGGADQAGGLVGYAQFIDISNSYATGDVKGGTYTGGLVGSAALSSITNSYATGDVDSSGNYVGGLVGVIQGVDVTDSYATGDVNSNTANVGPTSSAVGGLLGAATSEDNVISGSYATGNASGYNYVGGLIGYFTNGSVSNSYATGDIKGSNNYAGGLIGGMTVQTVTDSYATGNVDGRTMSALS